jgi:uncharacterized protein YbjT (DUF2867 family)
MQTILVTGATGNQGGAVIDHFLADTREDWEIHGLTRDASSERAQGLTARGVTVVEGDMTDGERMRDLLADVDVVFCMTSFFEAGADAETEQGKTLADAAADVGIGHFVYSSVGGADEGTGLAHFDSKWDVEQHLNDRDLTTTVIRPVFFMQNFVAMLGDEIRDGRLPMPLAEGVRLDVVDADDIGRTVLTVVHDPETFAGEVVTLGGDRLTLEEFAAAFGDHLGDEVEPVRLDIDSYRESAGDEMADMYTWFNEGGYEVDSEELTETLGWTPTTFGAYLAEGDAWRPAPAASR